MILGVETIIINVVCTSAVNVGFTQSVFSVFENESEMNIILDVSHPALTEFTVIIVASPDTANGKESNNINVCYYDCR